MKEGFRPCGGGPAGCTPGQHTGAVISAGPQPHLSASTQEATDGQQQRGGQAAIQCSADYAPISEGNPAGGSGRHQGSGEPGLIPDSKTRPDLDPLHQNAVLSGRALFPQHSAFVENSSPPGRSSPAQYGPI